MMQQSAIYTTGAPIGTFMTETIKSRFGEITVDMGKAVTFPRGLLGMPDKVRFVLAQFPNPKMQQFTLLQSLSDYGISFITLPLALQNDIIAARDIESACSDLFIAETNLAVLLIVSVHRSPDQVRLSVNARAPLIIDTLSHTGVQHVFQHDTYKVQHML